MQNASFKLHNRSIILATHSSFTKEINSLYTLTWHVHCQQVNVDKKSCKFFKKIWSCLLSFRLILFQTKSTCNPLCTLRCVFNLKEQSLHKKWSFPFRISSVNVTKKRRKLRIWSHLLKKSFMENFIFLWSES